MDIEQDICYEITRKIKNDIYNSNYAYRQIFEDLISELSDPTNPCPEEEVLGLLRLLDREAEDEAVGKIGVSTEVKKLFNGELHDPGLLAIYANRFDVDLPERHERYLDAMSVHFTGYKIED